MPGDLQTVKKRLADRTLLPDPFDIECCLIDVSTLFESDNFKENSDHVLNLDGLNPLRQQPINQDEFLPKKVFVRADMKTTFTNMIGSPHLRRKVLIGAPGVGKSVLFFLVALYRAKNEKKVLYYRRTRLEDNMSVFYMEPAAGSHVRVWFSRNMNKKRFTVNSADLAFCKLLELQDGECLAFVDGPNHGDDQNLLEETFSGLCTSGGYPTPAEEVWAIFQLCVLNGWTEEDIIDALQVLSNIGEKEAKRLFALCGGRIRRVLEAQQDETKIQRNLARLISRANKDMIELALTSTVYAHDSNNSDRLRTMFMRNDVDVLQIVDSRYVLNGLQQRMDTNDFLKAYKQARSLGLQGVSGVYFEELMHCWFRTKMPDPVAGFFRDNTLTGAESVAKLTKTMLYWVPGIPNFANIDSALVVGTVLYCFQYFVNASHVFDPSTFWQDMGYFVTDKCNITEIKVYWVVPSKSTFQDNRMSHTFHFNSGGKTKTSSSMRDVEATFYTAKIDVDKLDETPEQFANFA